MHAFMGATVTARKRTALLAPLLQGCDPNAQSPGLHAKLLQLSLTWEAIQAERSGADHKEERTVKHPARARQQVFRGKAVSIDSSMAQLAQTILTN